LVQSVLNRPAALNSFNKHTAEELSAVNCDKPTREEIMKAIMTLNNAKSAEQEENHQKH